LLFHLLNLPGVNLSNVQKRFAEPLGEGLSRAKTYNFPSYLLNATVCDSFEKMSSKKMKKNLYFFVDVEERRLKTWICGK